MKKPLTVVYICGFVLASVGIVLITFYLAGRYLSSNNDPSNCESKKTKHTVTIQNDEVSPKNTEASICDVLVITNADDKLRLVAFGQHDRHITYDGVEEENLRKNESITITLNTTGTYTFHDHLQDEVIGEFTVSK